MTSPFASRSPAIYRELLQRLQTFRSAYISYINATREAVYSGQPVENTAERSQVLQLAVLAEEAVLIAGIPVRVSPPPGLSHRPPVTGLAAVAFAHEDPVFRMGAASWASESYRQTFELAVDAVDSASARLENLLQHEQKRRRRPTYWIDRALRLVLGFPAYLISLIFGFDRRDLAPGPARALWALSVTIDIVATIVAVGSAFGWWS